MNVYLLSADIAPNRTKLISYSSTHVHICTLLLIRRRSPETPVTS